MSAEMDFRGEIDTKLKKATASCGFKIVVGTDFENYKASDWRDTKPSAVCSTVIGVVGDYCTSPKTKAAIVKQVKSLSCLFGGRLPKEEGEFENNSYTRRNMSLAAGVFTIHLAPDFEDLFFNTRDVLEPELEYERATVTIAPSRGQSSKPAKTAPTPKGSARGRMCSKSKDCQSGVCEMENKTRGRCR